MALDGTLAVSVGSDAVEFELVVENTGAQAQELSFRSGMQADFAVLADGEEVWRWSEGRMFTQALQTETLDAGDGKTVSANWSDPEPGDYVAVASLVSDPGVEVREEFSVP